MTDHTPRHQAMDGRQTAGRKGIPYDWRSVLAEGDVAARDEHGIAFETMTASIGLLLT